MVFILSIIFIFCCALCSVYQKKYELTQKKPTGLVFLFWQGFFCLVLTGIFYALGLSESGMPPWQILASQPLILAHALLMCFYNLFYVIAVYFIPSSLAESINGGTFIPIFIGMILINLSSGNFSSVYDMLDVRKIIVLLILVASVVLLPLTEKKDKEAKRGEKGMSERLFFTIGLVFVVLATLCDASNSIISDYAMSSDALGSVDFLIGTSFFEGIVGVLALFGLLIREKGRPALLSRKNRYPILAEVFGVTSVLLYCIAATYDAVLGEIIWISYPAVFLIFSAVFLKEKLNAGQKALLAVILVSNALFYVLDWLI